MWRIVRSSSPEVLASVDIKEGDELLLFYGEGHGPLRDYPVAEGLQWVETEDSYLSD